MVKEKTKFILDKWKEFYGIALKENLEGSRRYLYVFISWMIFLVFLSFSFLTEKNPFSLLLPFHVFELPKTDPRIESIVYVSDGEENVYPSKRLVFKKDSIRENIRELIEEVGRPPHFSNKMGAREEFLGRNLKKLPNLSIAIMSIWLRENKKEIILDFNSSEVLNEMKKFRFAKQIEDGSEEEELDPDSYYSPPLNFMDSKTLERMERKKEVILRLTLQAIAKTIQANYPEYEKVEFYLDGERKNREGVLSGFKDK